jgi:hypothetical protein
VVRNEATRLHLTNRLSSDLFTIATGRKTGPANLDGTQQCRPLQTSGIGSHKIATLFYTDFQSVMTPKSFNGLMFTYAAPRISRVLATTGESEHRIAKRVVDTA